MAKLGLSLVVITLNEEKNIARCIQSVPFASEIIVVDSESSDRTTEIAKGLGAQVSLRKFAGYRAQKEFATQQASQEWVLSLDADEALSPELASEIQLELTRARYEVYRMPRLSFHLGKWIHHGGWYPDYQTRLFKKKAAQWVGGAVHEHVESSYPTGTLKGNILHYVFEDFSDQVHTNNEFSLLGAQALLEKGETFKISKLALKPLGKFLECYLWKRGFLDGAPGFIIALGAAQSLFLKYAKLWEFQKTENT